MAVITSAQRANDHSPLRYAGWHRRVHSAAFLAKAEDGNALELKTGILDSVQHLAGKVRDDQVATAVIKTFHRNTRTLAASWISFVTISETAKALVGDDQPEHLFTLHQSLVADCHYQQLMAAWNWIFGVDLTHIAGVNALTAHR